MSHPTSLRIVCQLIAALIVGRSLPAVEGAEPAKTPYEQGSYKVESKLLDWHDAKRDRDVPVKIYLPADLKEAAPVIVFSHGLGGSRNGYGYLGEHWASRGYVSVHVQHAGSDQAVFLSGPPAGVRGRLESAAKDPATIINRPKDISFAVDQLEKLNAAGEELAGRLDLKRLGMAGHSFGAWTTLAIMGQKSDLPIARDFGMSDPRFKAAIAMSEPVPRAGANTDRVFSGITAPMMHMTGTLDDMPVGNSAASERRIPFDHIAAKDQFLVIFDGADHMVFSGRARQGGRPIEAKGMSGDPANDARFQELIRPVTAAFWDAWLKGDEKAKAWLKEGECKRLLGQTATFEQK